MKTFLRHRYSRAAVCIGLAFVLLGLVYVSHPFLLQGLGSYLVVDDPLEQAPAIVVLAGEMESGE